MLNQFILYFSSPILALFLFFISAIDSCNKDSLVRVVSKSKDLKDSKLLSLAIQKKMQFANKSNSCKNKKSALYEFNLSENHMGYLLLCFQGDFIEEFFEISIFNEKMEFVIEPFHATTSNTFLINLDSDIYPELVKENRKIWKYNKHKNKYQIADYESALNLYFFYRGISGGAFNNSIYALGFLIILYYLSLKNMGYSNKNTYLATFIILIFFLATLGTISLLLSERLDFIYYLTYPFWVGLVNLIVVKITLKIIRIRGITAQY